MSSSVLAAANVPTVEKDSCAQRTLVLYEAGQFFEFHGRDGQGTDVRAVCELLDIQATRKDKSKPESPSNPAIGRFPKQARDKYSALLLDANYELREVMCVRKGTARQASAPAPAITMPDAQIRVAARL